MQNEKCDAHFVCVQEKDEEVEVVAENMIKMGKKEEKVRKMQKRNDMKEIKMKNKKKKSEKRKKGPKIIDKLRGVTCQKPE